MKKGLIVRKKLYNYELNIKRSRKAGTVFLLRPSCFLTSICMIPEITCIIVDDEPWACENLSLMLGQYCPQVEVLGVCNKVTDAVTAIQEMKPDLVFLDIKLGRESGLRVLDLTMGIPKKVIFATAHNNYAVEAFRYAATHYLLKPFDVDALTDAVDKAKDKLDPGIEEKQIRFLQKMLGGKSSEKAKIFLPERGGWEALELNRIVYVEGNGSYVYVHLSTKEVRTVSKNLKQFATSLLSFAQFVRIHKSYIVNSDYIKIINKNEGGYLVLVSGQRLSVSKSYWDDLINCLKLD